MLINVIKTAIILYKLTKLNMKIKINIEIVSVYTYYIQF